jgi:phospholipid/cholesterol/gamma-HCH transport system permease protein
MSASQESSSARAAARLEGGLLEVDLGGPWSLQSATPRWSSVVGRARPSSVRLVAGAVSHWDTSLVVFVGEAKRWCREAGVSCDIAALPERMRLLGEQFADSLAVAPRKDPSVKLLVEVGQTTEAALGDTRDFLTFIGECWLGVRRILSVRPGFRWIDCLAEMQKCGAMALPIVSLISFLVGITLAYSGAIVLKRFGADIWVADLIGVAMTREMGAMMVGVVLAGRTGASFAAEIGSMKVNQEIDALKILGISPVRFLVIPRIIALGLMMPLLALYANCLGILGGMTIAYFSLEIPPTAYWVEMLTMVDMKDVTVGVIKAFFFGIIVGVSGCLRGLQADNNAAGVGRAATSSVVTAILFIIVADAIFAVLFNALGM